MRVDYTIRMTFDNHFSKWEAMALMELWLKEAQFQFERLDEGNRLRYVTGKHV